jgi:hypothetical protein
MNQTGLPGTKDVGGPKTTVEEGYYWVETRGVLTGKSYIHPVRVYSSKVGGTVDTVFSDGENFSINSDMFVDLSNGFQNEFKRGRRTTKRKG